MQNIPGLRSCYDKVGRLIYFGRMLDKIRVHAAAQLPPDYVENLGEHQFTLDGRCCRFLGVPYSEIKKRTLAGEPDEAVLNWAHAHGASRTDEECNVWNRFIAKDRKSTRLNFSHQIISYAVFRLKKKTVNLDDR